MPLFHRMIAKLGMAAALAAAAARAAPRVLDPLGDDIYSTPRETIEAALRAPTDPANAAVIASYNRWVHEVEEHMEKRFDVAAAGCKGGGAAAARRQRRAAATTYSSKVIFDAAKRQESHDLYDSMQKLELPDRADGRFTDWDLNRAREQPSLKASREVRFVVDNVIDEETCKILREGSEQSDLPWDALYPYFKNSLGGAVSYNVALEWADMDNMEAVKRMGIARESMRQHVQSYFNLSELYVEASHITRRFVSKDGALSAEHRGGWEHGMHADNCVDNEHGECTPQPWHCCFFRDYSAIMFLSDETQGGYEGAEFVFIEGTRAKAGYRNVHEDSLAHRMAEHKRDTQGIDEEVGGHEDGIERDAEATKLAYRFIKPKCGRMMSFTSGGDNLHGVHIMGGTGKRYAYAMWLSVDERRAEYYRAHEWFHRDGEENTPKNIDEYYTNNFAEKKQKATRGNGAPKEEL